MARSQTWFASFAGACLSAVLLVLWTPAHAQGPAAGTPAPAERSFAIGANVGILFPGTITIEDVDVDTDSGFAARLAGDFFLMPRLSMGLYLQMVRTSASEVDVDASMLGVGGTIVGHFGNPNGGHFKAGVALGYQMSEIDTPGSSDVTGFGVGPLVEFVYPAGGVSWLAHLSFITQPAGGNSDVDVTWGPIFTLGVGAEFGR